MKSKRKRAPALQRNRKMKKFFSNFVTIVLFLIFVSAFYLVISFTPLTTDEQIDRINKMNDEVEPFRKNLSLCAQKVKASMVEVEHFLKRVPQSTMEGKCFVACILMKNAIIKNNKIDQNHLLELNRMVYNDDSEVVSRLKVAINECNDLVNNIFEICEYASMFNDCMHMKMEHILDKVTMERRMEVLGQMTSNPDEWTDEEDEMLKLVKDEL